MKWAQLCRGKDQGGLGFRDLHEFHIALLGKQAWQLLAQQNSLASKVFKAKYFPNSSFLEPKRGANQSYMWSSLLASQDLIRQGARWRVGNEQSIPLWNTA